MLAMIRHNIYAKNVFVSGAYEEDIKFADTSVGELTRNLCQRLIENDYKIYTGYGKNLGADIVAGAFGGCTTVDDSTSKEVALKRFEDLVHLFPFPYKKDMEADTRKAFYTELRKNAIANTSITIAINGTKRVNDKLIASDGSLEEVHIAAEQGNKIIPIAITGGAANQIWMERKNRKERLTDTEPFETLNNSKATLNDIIDAVLSLCQDIGTKEVDK
jgi:hypothetical protein